VERVVPEDLAPVMLDDVLIGQVLANLVENAAKYTPPGSTIQVTAQRRGAHVVVSVEDDGPGIPAAAAPHVFEKFFRVAGGDRAAVSGTGLGLAIARGFVRAHGGDVDVVSPPPARRVGTRFSFWLPAQPAGDWPSEAWPEPATGDWTGKDGAPAPDNDGAVIEVAS
jgi:two-component system sensor histidine kinase KdpD